MSLYNFEFFDRALNCTAHAQADVDYIETDYIAAENTTLKILKNETINVQDIVTAQELPDFVGIVTSVDHGGDTSTIQIKPFVTLFEKPYIFNTARQLGEIELRMGLNYLYKGSPSDDARDEFYIFLKPNEYKFGLFNAAGEGGVAFKNIDDIKADNTQFVAKCGNSLYNVSEGQIYGPRVCANGAVNQPDVDSGRYLYYRIDNDGATTYGYWDRSMIKGSTTQDGETISGDDWLRKNVQLMCSPSYIFAADNDKYEAYSAYSHGAGFDTEYAFWSFFGKDRHGRIFLGKYGKYRGNATLTPRGLWDTLVKYCGITELAIVGGGWVETDISIPNFMQLPSTPMRGWVLNDMTKIGTDWSMPDTFAFYRTYGENEQEKKPCIRTNLEHVKIDPDYSLENTIAFEIRADWIARSTGEGYNDDRMMDFPITCRTTSDTQNWTLGIKPDNQASDGTIFPACVTDFYSTTIQEAFKQYRIALDAAMDWTKKKIVISIGVNNDVVHIDADLPNVKIKEFVNGKAQTSTNKLIVWDVNGYDKIMTFYRYNTLQIVNYKGIPLDYGTNDLDRMYPVVEEVVSVDTSTNEGEPSKDFKALAWEQAESLFGSIKYKNYIELEIYNPPYIQLGQVCYIHHDGEIYETILSGYKEGDMKTLIFGAYRGEYTKSMIIKENQVKANAKKATRNAWTSSR